MTLHTALKNFVIVAFMVNVIVACTFTNPASLTPTSTMLATGSPTPDIAQLQPIHSQPTPLPFEGLWVSESDDLTRTDQVLAITGKSFYWIRTGNWARVVSEQGKPGGAHEEYAEIVSYDLQQGYISLRINWVRYNGVFVGFGDRGRDLFYVIDGDSIKVSSGGDDPFETYYRK